LFYLLLAGFFMIISVTFAESLAYVPFLTELKFPVYAFGYFWSGIYLASALAPLVTKKIMGKSKPINFLIFSTSAGSLILLLIYFVHSYSLALLVILSALFFYTFSYPIERPYFHKFVPSKMRATIGSFRSVIYSLAGIIAFPIGGWLIDLIGARWVIVISALLGIPMIISYMMVEKKYHR
jgi:MFS family permease